MTKLSIASVRDEASKRLAALRAQAASSNAEALMRSAERYEGRAPAYAQDLRRAAQASLMLDTCCQF